MAAKLSLLNSLFLRKPGRAVAGARKSRPTVLKRSKGPDPQAIGEAIVATSHESIVAPLPNVSTTAQPSGGGPRCQCGTSFGPVA